MLKGIEIKEVGELAALMERAWSRQTSADPKGWTKQNSAWGQCAVTACIVQDHFGGTLLRVNAWVPEISEPIGHYFNKLPDDAIVDLSRKQFPKGTMFGPEAERSREYVLDPRFTTLRRYRLLMRRLKKLAQAQRSA